MALTNKLTAIADAIRAKTGGSAALSLDDMVTEIGSITGGGSSSGLNDDFRAYVESADPQLSFTTYTSTGTAIRKNLSRTNITDINMPNLTTIKEQIPINNTIARKLESYALTDINVTSGNGVFVGECDKLELTQTAAAHNYQNAAIKSFYVAAPNLTNTTGLGGGNGSGITRKIYQAPENNTATGNFSGNINRVKTLIITRTSSIVTLNSTANNYFYPNIEVYVPKSLLNSYKTATNWSTIADHIYAVEDSYAELGDIFTSLNTKYNWTTRELTLVEKMKRQKARHKQILTYNELVTIANDLADNGSNSDYYNYTDCLLINDGLPIANNVYLFITDAFKYIDANGDPIPLSGMLSERNTFQDNFIDFDTNKEVGLYTLQGNQNFNNANTSNGFYDTTLYHKMNDNDGSLITLLPSSFTDNLVDFMIDDAHTAKLAPPTCTEFGVTPQSNAYDDFSQNSKLNFFIKNNIVGVRGNRNIQTRSTQTILNQYFTTIAANGSRGGGSITTTASVIPVFALGKKGVNNA